MDTELTPQTPVAPGTVVVGVDGSEGADRALAWGTEQARLECRPLTLVHVVDDKIVMWAGEPGFDVADVLTPMTQEGRELLADALASVGTPEGPAVATHLVQGDPRQVLLGLSHDASMIVLGSRGRGPVASLLLGSVSVGVTRHAACPVVVVRPDDPAHDGTGERVVVGVRTGRPLGHAIEFAFRQAALRAVPLRVVHGPWEELFGYAGAAVVSTDENALSEDLRSTKTLLAGLREKFPDVEVSYEPAGGLPDACLLTASHGSGTVVVGTEHPRAAKTLLEGNVASSVTEHAHCPVVVVPEP